MKDSVGDDYQSKVSMSKYEDIKDAEVEAKYESPYVAIVSMEKRISSLEEQIENIQINVERFQKLTRFKCGDKLRTLDQ